jgi:hypothetical protein
VPDATFDQPPPRTSASPPAWPLVIADVRRHTDIRDPAAARLVADMEARDAFGREKYGVSLAAGNGRDSLVDAYQECLDAVAYLRVAMDGATSPLLYDAYRDAIDLALKVRRALDAREAPRA